MAHLPPATVTAILNSWNVQNYDGSQDARQWLRTIEERCQIYGVPQTQMTEMAVRCTAGEANRVLGAMLEAHVNEAGVWPWQDFRRQVIQTEGGCSQPCQPRT